MSRRTTVPAFRAAKRSSGAEPLVMVTAYDAPSARMADRGGVDAILVGDSVAMAVLGYEDTLSVTTEDMVHHVAAVCRSRPEALVIADMPWMSYHRDLSEAIGNAARLIRAGAQAVKLEGGRKREAVVAALVDAEIPVMGHLGLTPQSVNAFGGFKVQAKDAEAARRIVADARGIADAGAFAVVLEGIPVTVAAMVTTAVTVPTIGIGAGPGCDGQVMVIHDLLGLEDRLVPRFVRRYAEMAAEGAAAVAAFVSDVRSGSFPDDEESYHLGADVAIELGAQAAGSVGAGPGPTP